MSININSFILTDNMIELMKEKLKKTESLNRELGFNLCKVDESNELKDDTHCIGSDCRITLETVCKIGKKVGLYHTHPRNGGEGTSNPSIADLQNGYFYGMNCIGGIVDQKIRCYIRKDKVMNPKDYKTITYNRERFESIKAGKIHHVTTRKGHEIIKSKFRDLVYTRDKLRDSYFNIIDVV